MSLGILLAHLAGEVVVKASCSPLRKSSGVRLLCPACAEATQLRDKE